MAVIAREQNRYGMHWEVLDWNGLPLSSIVRSAQKFAMDGCPCYSWEEPSITLRPENHSVSLPLALIRRPLHPKPLSLYLPVYSARKLSKKE